MLGEGGVEEGKLAGVEDLVLLNRHHHFVGGVDLGEVLLGDPHHEGHEALLSCVQEVGGQVGDVHVTPLEGKNHPHDRLYDEGREVGVV